tara:strand:- start:4 stop:225 length:222 start_codon:yes stop_codon:yes gene_type:complete
MLKIKQGIVIQGNFDTWEHELPKLVREAKFSTIVVHTNTHEFEEKCQAITDNLAGEGLMYAKKYVIARAAYES